MRYFKIVSSVVDGPGERAVLFVQGCPLACDGCQNKHLWPERTPDTLVASSRDLAVRLVALNPRAVTLSGGEVFEQLHGLVSLVEWLRVFSPGIHITVYSGYTWEELQAKAKASAVDGRAIRRVLAEIDILVDGRFVRSLDNAFLSWRGSTNQRPINVPATLESGQIVTHDWSKPVVVFAPEASYAPIGMAQVLGKGEATRRCGQTK